jgi:hypothetical protein
MGFSDGNGLWGLTKGLWGGAAALWSGDSGLSGGGGETGFDLLLEGSSGGFVLLEDGTTFIELENGPGLPEILQTSGGVNLQTDAGVQITESA